MKPKTLLCGVAFIIVIYIAIYGDEYKSVFAIEDVSENISLIEITNITTTSNKTYTDTNIAIINDNNTNDINPLLKPQCRNAIIDYEHTVITPHISTTSSGCPHFSGLYTRESLDAYNQSVCPGEHGMLRSHQTVINALNEYNKEGHYSMNASTEAWIHKFPIYLMLPKGGSSSIWKILQSTNKYTSFGSIAQTKIPNDVLYNFNSECVFTFARSPVSRVISGYYTINAQLWRNFESTFDNYFNKTLREQRKHLPNWTYIATYGEPQRFRMFIDELVAEPQRFTSSSYADHVRSATDMFQKHFGSRRSNLRFMGRVETFNSDMIELMKVCDNYFNVAVDARLMNRTFISHQMPGFGWGKPSSWFHEWDYHLNWIKSMDLWALYNYWKENKNIKSILPPAYYAVDRVTYEKIINYYIQDIKCFGYEYQIPYENFLEKLKSHQNIYNDSKYQFTRSEP